LQLTIEKMVYGGDGLARLPADEHGPGKAVFVPFVLAGENVEATLVEEKPGFSRAIAAEVLAASDQRIEPLCPYYRRCGGCQYQHTDYEHQLRIKSAILHESLRRIAKLQLDQELRIHRSPPWNYRNRIRIKVQSSPEFSIGFHRFASHELLPVKECPISSPLLNRAVSALWQLGRAADGVRGIELFANADDRQLLVELDCEPGVGENNLQLWLLELQAALPELAGASAVSSDGDPREQRTSPRLAAFGNAELTYRTEAASYRVSAGAFFQVNRHLVGQLVNLITRDQSGTLALDLYSGVGLFARVLARAFAQVIAVESSPISYPDLVHNSPANVKAVRADTEQYLEKAAERLRPDFVVVDPPRNGLGGRVVKRLVDLQSPRIAYVSCDPATLSRDLVALVAAGYRVKEAHLVDLFPQTYHLESVFHLAR
jgi:23S rRNA (uracil1939-C5)-methyltransferase